VKYRAIYDRAFGLRKRASGSSGGGSSGRSLSKREVLAFVPTPGESGILGSTGSPGDVDDCDSVSRRPLRRLRSLSDNAVKK
jgi:hypothetical protein